MRHFISLFSYMLMISIFYIQGAYAFSVKDMLSQLSLPIIEPSSLMKQMNVKPKQAEKIQLAQNFWSPGFDTGEEISTVRNIAEPTLSPLTRSRIDFAVFLYERIAQQGGWPQVPSHKILHLGISDEAVRALRSRLIVGGDLAKEIGISDVFDHYVRAGVMRFQARHGLVPDGIVGEETFNALNVSVEERLAQLRINATRLSDINFEHKNYIMVNIPAASIEFVEEGRVVSRHTAVVGKDDRQTPILESQIVEVNFNPYWTVPKSIILKDLIPKMNEDPTYLERFKIRIFDEDNNELNPTQINWQTEEAVNYRFTQDPGELNSLGRVRINFPNNHQVYLHDTPGKNLFGGNYRFHSSGCVRVANVRDFVTRLLAPNGWTRAQVDQAIRSGERMDVDLNKKKPLHMQYITAWVSDLGAVQFREDIYGYDKEAALMNTAETAEAENAL